MKRTKNKVVYHVGIYNIAYVTLYGGIWNSALAII